MEVRTRPGYFTSTVLVSRTRPGCFAVTVWVLSDTSRLLLSNRAGVRTREDVLLETVWVFGHVIVQVSIKEVPGRSFRKSRGGQNTKTVPLSRVENPPFLVL